MSIAATQSIGSLYPTQNPSARPLDTNQPRERDQGDVVSLSSAARTRLEGTEDVSKAVDDLLTNHGSDIFGSIKSLRTYPENLAGQLDNDRLSEADRTEIAGRMGERENAALSLARSTFDQRTYAKAYIEFYDSLSPEEQNSDRYRGTREQMVAVYERASADQGEPAEDLSGPQDPILMLFDKIKAMAFKIDDSDGFIARVWEAAGPLLDSEVNGERFAVDLESALGRFTDIQALIVAARQGDAEALGGLRALAGEP